MLGRAHLSDLVEAYSLGTAPTLSDAPVARGRLGHIWRLDTDRGAWAVKELPPDETEDGIAGGARFQEAAVRSGVPAPSVVRTTSGRVVLSLPGTRVRVYGWVDLLEPDIDLDPGAVGRLIAALHQVEFSEGSPLDTWYTAPVGSARWRELVGRLRAARAPFADELDALVPELVALEDLLGGEHRQLRTCHRDLWADNLRGTPDGRLCVFDFENSGLADPGQELATALFEFCSLEPSRARVLTTAYRDEGGPGRVETAADFAMAVAQQGHIVEEGCRRWLAARSEEARADNEAWVREFTDRPLTREVIAQLLDA